MLDETIENILYEYRIDDLIHRFNRLSLDDVKLKRRHLNKKYVSTIAVYRKRILDSVREINHARQFRQVSVNMMDIYRDVFNPVYIPRYTECIRRYSKEEYVRQLHYVKYRESLYYTYDISKQPMLFFDTIPIIRTYFHEKYGSLYSFFISEFIWDNPYDWDSQIGVQSSIEGKRRINQYFENVLRENYELIIFPIAKHKHHILTMLNTRTKKIYIFETYGKCLYTKNADFAFTIPQIHHELTKLDVFRDYTLHDFNTEHPYTFVQYYAEKYGTNKKYWADPLGYCVFWSWFTLDYFFSNPLFKTNHSQMYKNLEQDLIRRILHTSSEQCGMFLSEFIRDYYIGICSMYSVC